VRTTEELLGSHTAKSQSLEYTSRKVKGNQMRNKLNGTDQLLICADDINLLGDNINTINKNTETLIDSSKEVGLEVNTDKTKYMLMSRHQNAVLNHNIKIANRYFEDMAKLRYLRMVINQNLIHEEIKSGLN
jgi:hypothetical protein